MLVQGGGQALLPGDGGPGAPFLLVGPVQVLCLGQSFGGVDGGREFVGEFAWFSMAVLISPLRCSRLRRY